MPVLAEQHHCALEWGEVEAAEAQAEQHQQLQTHVRVQEAEHVVEQRSPFS